MTNKNKDLFAIKLQEWNERIRSGDKLHVQSEMHKLDYRSIPRPLVADYADVARRIGLFLLGLKILHTFVHSPGGARTKPTEKELQLWAALLIKLGSSEEALRILEKLNQNDPQVLLFTSFAHISQWDYSKAATSLRGYLKCESLEPYQKTVGQINLGAAYVYLKSGTKARHILSSALVTSNQNNWHLLKSNALELLAGTAILNEQWESAQRHLALASELLTDSPLDTLLIRKMMILIALKSGRARANAITDLEKLREEAAGLRHWETVRDCDYHLGLETKDASRLNLVYFGTPYPSYKKELLKASAAFFKPGDSYCWDPSSPGHEKGQETGHERSRKFDLASGKEIGGEANLERGSILHKFLIALSSDFFRPHFVGALFSAVYSGEHFDPDTSPARIARLVSRLREWLKEHKIPIAIETADLTYRLHATGPYCFLIRSSIKVPESRTEHLREDAVKRLREHWPYQSFSSKDAAEFLQLAPRTVQNYLTWAAQNRKVRATGTGRAKRYHFAK